ncbi:MAG: ABC transporter substrate-binding protein, partial [Mariprofundus sp.]|nr:ABC transporter substrate-binding protein [Mariprofundus sp.]
MMKFFQRITIVVVMLLATSAWAADESPRAVIENTVNQLIDVLEHRENSSVISSQDRQAIRQVVEGRFDYRSMA